MVRTVWLGLFLLLGMGALASFKFAFSQHQAVSLPKAVAFVAADSEPSSVGTAFTSDTLTKGDRLKIVYVAPAIDVKPVATENATAPPPIRSAAPAPKIIGRHWHDPNDRNVTQGAKQRPKAGDSRKSAPTGDRKPAVQASSCKPDALDGLRQLFNARSNCAKAN